MEAVYVALTGLDLARLASQKGCSVSVVFCRPKSQDSEFGSLLIITVASHSTEWSPKDYEHSYS